MTHHPLGYPDDWRARRRRVFARDNAACVNCGARDGDEDVTLHCHHIVDVSSGGTHDDSNLTTLCEKCHRATHNPNVMAPTVGLMKGAETGTEPDPEPEARVHPPDGWRARNGSVTMHLVIATLTFWTFGLGNVAYAAYRQIRYRRRTATVGVSA